MSRVVKPARRRAERTFPPLDYAIAAQNGVREAEQTLAEAESERGRAFLSAAHAGWTMREIAERTGLSASTVNRIIVHAEPVSLSRPDTGARE